MSTLRCHASGTRRAGKAVEHQPPSGNQDTLASSTGPTAPGAEAALTHVTRGDVLDDLGFTRSETTALKFKADLLDAIRAEIERRSYTQRQLVNILDEHQPAVSNLIREESIR